MEKIFWIMAQAMKEAKKAKAQGKTFEQYLAEKTTLYTCSREQFERY